MKSIIRLIKSSYGKVLLVAFALGLSFNSEAQLSEEEMAKIAQNPIANLISVPFNYSFNTNMGPFERTQKLLKINPVVPFAEGKVIARFVIPIVDQPNLLSEEGSTSGLSDISLSVFYTAKKGDFAFGFGPVVNMPTAKEGLGAKEWGLGPTGVIVYKKGQWVAGTLINQIWSLESDAINNMLIQMFINYNLPKGYYLTTAPAITANWNAIRRNTWTVPFGMGAGKIVKLGMLPLNVQAGAYYNVEKPMFANDWSFKVSATMLLPTALFKKG